MTVWPEPAWLAGLPEISGGYERNVMLAEYTTIRVGGPAEVWARPAGWDELSLLVQNKPQDVDLTIVGKGSNLVVKDGGVPGIVVHLEKGFDAVRVEGEIVYAEAGAATGTAARAAREAGLTGLEFFGGIPGSVGGALRMNAGAYGSETYDRLLKLWVMDEKGETREVEPGFVQPRYRGTELPPHWIYKAGLWQLQPGEKEVIRERMREINRARSSTQPLHMPSSGSWFKNVVLERDSVLGKAGEKVNAWKVVDAAGCRGWQEGGAQVSEQHCNFFVNTGGATAKDLDKLSLRVEAEILARLGIVMVREVRFTGVD